MTTFSWKVLHSQHCFNVKATFKATLNDKFFQYNLHVSYAFYAEDMIIFCWKIFHSQHCLSVKATIKDSHFTKKRCELNFTVYSVLTIQRQKSMLLLYLT